MEYSGWQTQFFCLILTTTTGLTEPLLRRKVASKTEGLVILSREVEELREELQQVAQHGFPLDVHQYVQQTVILLLEKKITLNWFDKKVI